MGFLFHNESVGLLADIPKEKVAKENGTVENANSTILWAERVELIKDQYKDNAKNCWIACGAYVIVFAYSAIRMFMIVR